MGEKERGRVERNGRTDGRTFLPFRFYEYLFRLQRGRRKSQNNDADESGQKNGTRKEREKSLFNSIKVKLNS